jgi:hypothetical protein
MDDVPHIIGGQNVTCFAVVNLLQRCGRHILQPVAGYAICQIEAGGYYLFACDSQWNEFADTWHEEIDDAIDQAESKYTGIRDLFQYK